MFFPIASLNVQHPVAFRRPSEMVEAIICDGETIGFGFKVRAREAERMSVGMRRCIGNQMCNPMDRPVQRHS